MKNFTLFLFLLTQTIGFTQTKTITGTVTDESSMPLPGVNIIVKGEKNGTQTDFDGNYTITADVGDILVFSYVGLKTVEVTIENSNTISATLIEDVSLEYFITYCGPSNNFVTSLNYGVNYNTVGASIKSNLYYLFNFSLHTEIGLGYHTDFDKNKKTTLDFNLPSLIYLRGFGNLGLDTNYTDIDFENNLDFKIYNFNATVNTWELFYHDTELSTGVGIGKFNNSNTKVGYAVGLKQRLPLRFEPYISTTFWKNFTEIKTGVHWSFKRFNFQYEYHNLDAYKEHTIAAGYKLYF